MANKVENFVNTLRRWQGIERESMNMTAEIMEETDNPLVRMIMEIIRHDSLMHHRVQQFLIDSVTKADVPVSREELAAVWKRIEAHDRVEKKTIEMAEQLKEKAWSPVHKQLLSYLLTDEKKHDHILDQLNQIKSGMTKSSGA